MAFSYNTGVHSTTNFAPTQLMFGSNLRILIDNLYGTVDEKYKHVATDTFAKQLSKMYAIARQNMDMKQIRYKTYYGQKVVDSKLQVNDSVYVYLPRLRNVILVTKWSGPHKIVEVLHPVYIFEIITNQGPIRKAIPKRHPNV